MSNVQCNALFLVKALVEGHVVARELRLRDPLQLQRHLVLGLREQLGRMQEAPLALPW